MVVIATRVVAVVVAYVHHHRDTMLTSNLHHHPTFKKSSAKKGKSHFHIAFHLNLRRLPSCVQGQELSLLSGKDANARIRRVVQ